MKNLILTTAILAFIVTLSAQENNLKQTKQESISVLIKLFEEGKISEETLKLSISALDNDNPKSEEKEYNYQLTNKAKQENAINKEAKTIEFEKYEKLKKRFFVNETSCFKLFNRRIDVLYDNKDKPYAIVDGKDHKFIHVAPNRTRINLEIDYNKEFGGIYYLEKCLFDKLDGLNLCTWLNEGDYFEIEILNIGCYLGRAYDYGSTVQYEVEIRVFVVQGDNKIEFNHYDFHRNVYDGANKKIYPNKFPPVLDMFISFFQQDLNSLK